MAENLDLRAVKLQVSDIKRLDDKKLKLHKTEPRWSVVERALDLLEKRELKK